MSGTVEITMTQRGFQVSSPAGTATFKNLEEAVEFARARLQRAHDIREISARIG
jgi:hypothetical protein